MDLRVGAGVGHGEETGAGVLLVEVLVGELLAVDGLAASALLIYYFCQFCSQLPQARREDYSRFRG